MQILHTWLFLLPLKDYFLNFRKSHSCQCLKCRSSCPGPADFGREFSWALNRLWNRKMTSFSLYMYSQSKICVLLNIYPLFRSKMRVQNSGPKNFGLFKSPPQITKVCIILKWLLNFNDSLNGTSKPKYLITFDIFIFPYLFYEK